MMGFAINHHGQRINEKKSRNLPGTDGSDLRIQKVHETPALHGFAERHSA